MMRNVDWFLLGSSAVAILMLLGSIPSGAGAAAGGFALSGRVTTLEKAVRTLDRRVTTLERILRPLLGRPKSRARPSVKPTRSPSVIESQIDGDFEGWSGDTLFKLTNGQIWQQASYAYTYSYRFMPKVTIYKTSAGYRMKVDGVSETILVKRIK